MSRAERIAGCLSHSLGERRSFTVVASINKHHVELSNGTLSRGAAMHPQPCFRVRDSDQVLCRVVKADSDDHELRWSRADHGRCDLVFGSRLRRILLWGIALHTDTDQCWFSRVNEAKEFGNCNR
jgi:hypothetical protein